MFQAAENNLLLCNPPCSFRVINVHTNDFYLHVCDEGLHFSCFHWILQLNLHVLPC